MCWSIISGEFSSGPYVRASPHRSQSLPGSNIRIAARGESPARYQGIALQLAEKLSVALDFGWRSASVRENQCFGRAVQPRPANLSPERGSIGKLGTLVPGGSCIE